MNVNSENVQTFVIYAFEMLNLAVQQDLNEELECIALSLRRVMKLLGRRTLGVDINPKLVSDIAILNPQAALVLFQLAKDSPEKEWTRYFIHKLITILLEESFVYKILTKGQHTWAPMLKLMQEIGSLSLFEQFADNNIKSDFLMQLIPPSQLLKLSEQNPEATLAFVQLVRELVGKGSLCINSEYFDELLKPRLLLDLSEQNPETALALVQLTQEAVGKEFLQRITPEYFEETLQPRRLLDFSERNPEAALKLLQLARVLVGEGKLHINQRYFERALDPRRLLELSEQHPELALTLVQLTRESIGEGFQQLINPKSFEEALHKRRLLDLNERNPEAALTLVQLSRELMGKKFLEYITPEYFERALQTHRLLELSEQNLGASLALVKLAREQGEGKLHLDSKYFDEMLKPRRLLDINEHNPEVALALVQLASEVMGDEFLKKHSEGFIDRWLSNLGTNRILSQKPTHLAVPLRLAKISKSPKAIENVHKLLVLSLSEINSEEISFSMLPIAILNDLKWLAKETNCSVINSTLKLLLIEDN